MDGLRLAVLCTCALLLYQTRFAEAQKPDLFAQYEEQLIQSTLIARGLSVEPNPTGKKIESIQIAAHEIFLPGDLPLSHRLPWLFLNRFHTRSREYIISQELLIHVGEIYQPARVEESERNLRAMFILAVARLIPVRGSTPNSVGILVVTKDRWTLRLNTSFVLDGTRVDQLAFSVSESNLLGRNKRVSLEFSLDPGRFAFGTSYLDPRIWSSRNSAYVYGLLYFNRDSRDLEGELLQVTLGRPLFSLSTRFSWQANFNFLNDIVRFFRGGDIAMVAAGSEMVPDIYTRRNILGNLQVTYSDGLVNKANVTVGFRVSDAEYALPSDFPNVSASARNAYLQTLPRSESWAGPFFALEFYEAHYVKLKNINTYALTEDFRLGPRLYIEAHLASSAFGLPSDFFEVSAVFNHQFLSHENLFDYGLTVNGRLQYKTAQAAGYVSPLVNESLIAYLREVTPLFGPLRLVIYGTLQLRARDLDNLRLTLGSDNGLRGFPTRYFQGNNLYHMNVELRSKALNLWTVHAGAVLFYDGGDAPAGLNQYDRNGTFQAAGWHQDVGIGLRILFPQFNRDVVRLDLGFPFEALPSGYVPRFSAEFAQAF